MPHQLRLSLKKAKPNLHVPVLSSRQVGIHSINKQVSTDEIKAIQEDIMRRKKILQNKFNQDIEGLEIFQPDRFNKMDRQIKKSKYRYLSYESPRKNENDEVVYE